MLKPGGIAYIGGGRGSVSFQELRKQQDPEWFPQNFDRDAEFRKRLASHMLPDEAYCEMFREWEAEFVIYGNEGDGHWFCWRKIQPMPDRRNELCEGGSLND